MLIADAAGRVWPFVRCERGKLTAIEVKFAKDGVVNARAIERVLEDTAAAAKELMNCGKVTDVSLVLAVVTDRHDQAIEANLRQQLAQIANGYEVPVDLHLYDLDGLKAEFGLVHRATVVEDNRTSGLTDVEPLVRQQVPERMARGRVAETRHVP